jgi:hypothetical protein
VAAGFCATAIEVVSANEAARAMARRMLVRERGAG